MRRPKAPSNTCPADRTARPSPLLYASASAVMGSRATEDQRSGNVSRPPVKSCRAGGARIGGGDARTRPARL